MQALPCIELNNEEQKVLKSLASQVIKSGAENSKLLLPPAPMSTNLKQIAASFVTIYISNELRGCIGAIEASDPLWLDVCNHSYSSAFEDSRFLPITIDELPQLSFTISILSAMVPIKNQGEKALLSQLNVGVDGLLLKQGHRSAVFLPSVWDSFTSAESFLTSLKYKGGWPEDYWNENIELFIFHTLLI